MHDDEECRPIPSWVNKKSRTAKNASTPTPTPSPPTPSPPTLSPPLPPSLPPQLPASSQQLLPPLPPAVLPDEFKNRIRELNGSDIQFVMSKKLFQTDLTLNHDRLSMPMREVRCDFLTKAEKATLDERDCAKRKLVGVELKMLDPSLTECTLSLKKWNMTSTSIYCLTKNWKSVVTHNNLQKDDQLQIWSFRVDGKLHFVLNKL
ncbi:putative B3 domain-containing protein At2g27410 [Gastrolobium bilobum]|uniref:putative B3 domain-containing protein At2g27410 n=1 Tax=Gastrolobium bilobum TaxID=150636 RepID=UPI002AB1425D|nr:putative B3 domain-containing protein At2g27410 [Gastrolobium bilobum]